MPGSIFLGITSTFHRANRTDLRCRSHGRDDQRNPPATPHGGPDSRDISNGYRHRGPSYLDCGEHIELTSGKPFLPPRLSPSPPTSGPFHHHRLPGQNWGRGSRASQRRQKPRRTYAEALLVVKLHWAAARPCCFFLARFGVDDRFTTRGEGGPPFPKLPNSPAWTDWALCRMPACA